MVYKRQHFLTTLKFHDYPSILCYVHWESKIKHQTMWDLRYSWHRSFRLRSSGLWHHIVWLVVADVSGKPAVNISRPDHSGLTIPYGLLSLGLWCGRLEYRSGHADIPAFLCVVFYVCRQTFGFLERRKLPCDWQHK